LISISRDLKYSFQYSLTFCGAFSNSFKQFQNVPRVDSEFGNFFSLAFREFLYFHNGDKKVKIAYKIINYSNINKNYAIKFCKERISKNGKLENGNFN